jgi:RNA polymerase sigma-70 factor (ECF subfamily)
MIDPSPSGTSSSLIDRVKADEEGAWDRLVSLYAPLLYHWCRRWNLQDEDLADVFQEVFKTLILHIGEFRREYKGDTFRGWMRTITRNKVLDHFRRQRREVEGGSDANWRLSQLASPEEPGTDQEEEAELHRLFHRGLELIRTEFEERTWKAFWRTAIDGKTPQEVAIELSTTPGAVRVAKSRVLQRLREELGDTP